MPETLRVLLAQHERNLRGRLSDSLRAAGYAVDPAANPARALRALTSSHYDVPVLEGAVPDRDTPAVCRRLRAEGDRTPILVLSAEVEDRIAQLEAGAD